MILILNVGSMCIGQFQIEICRLHVSKYKRSNLEMESLSMTGQLAMALIKARIFPQLSVMRVTQNEKTVEVPSRREENMEKHIMLV